MNGDDFLIYFCDEMATFVCARAIVTVLNVIVTDDGVSNVNDGALIAISFWILI